MSTETGIFNCLLELRNLYGLYKKIGIVLKTTMDISDSSRSIAYKNSIDLLKTTGMIEKTEENYTKAVICSSANSFSKELIERIKKTYKDAVSIVVNCEKHYDDVNDRFYFYMNQVPLKLMGLVMLMEQAGEFEKERNRFYFYEILRYDSFFKDSRKKSLEDLHKQLQYDEELGEEAEKNVLLYEKEKLRRAGINKNPIRVSEIDVMAGFDIASFFSDSERPNKFIEVKSCNDSLRFHLSRNEIEKAKEKRESYFIYLYVRTSGDILEIQNPYERIFRNSNEWNYEAESFIVTSLHGR